MDLNGRGESIGSTITSKENKFIALCILFCGVILIYIYLVISYLEIVRQRWDPDEPVEVPQVVQLDPVLPSHVLNDVCKLFKAFVTLLTRLTHVTVE